MKMPAARIPNKRVATARTRKHQHLLEVSVRAGVARSQRIRAFFRIGWKVALAVVLVVGSYVGGKEGLRRFLWENPDYFLTDIRVSTDGTLTREQIIHTSGIVEGCNIFRVDLAEAREAIDALPQVERAELQRVYPNRVNITVTERRPIAWVVAKAEEDATASDKSFLIDARGIVMRSKVLLPEYYHLPVISGIPTENLAAGQKVTALEMQSALELVRINADSTRWQLRNIDLARGYCMVVSDQRRAKFTFGLDNIDAQLVRLNRLLDTIEPTHKEIRTVNLMLERNIPVTFAEPVGEEPAPPAPPAKGDPLKQKFTATKGPAVKGVATPKPQAAPAKSKEKSTPAPARRSSPVDGLKKPFRTSNA